MPSLQVGKTKEDLDIAIDVLCTRCAVDVLRMIITILLG